MKLSSVELTINNDDTFDALYTNVEKAYHLVVNCNRIWDITTSKAANKVQLRSFADKLITRIEVNALLESSNLICSTHIPLKLQNKNGGDLFFYPGFLIMQEEQLDFAILDYSEIDIEFLTMQFIEDGAVPNDSEVVGNTWFKVNKDGTPERRFSNNFKIPITK